MTRALWSRASVVLCTASALLLALAFSVAPPSQAQQTERAKQLGKKLMCMCGCNQILTACNHVGCTYSRTMLKELDQAVARNESDDLTLQAFVQEYGPKVMAEVPAKGFNWAAWIVPVLAPLIALYLVWEVVRRWRQRAALAPASGAGISSELLDRARREVEKESDE